MSFDQVFTMPAFEGLRAVRVQLAAHPDRDFDAVVKDLRVTDSDFDSFDMEAAEILHEILPDGIDASGSIFYQNCILHSVLHFKPKWSRNIPLGRSKFFGKLSDEDQSIFRRAGLMIHPPGEHIVAWWDEIESQIRFARSADNHERGRLAEQLTLQHEAAYLERVGLAETPEWTAIEDNTAGYDVLSYRPGKFGPISRLIEVKSTLISPVRFHVTQNEWRKAQGAPESYKFYVWELHKEPYEMHELAVAQVAPHIPSDNGEGKWQDVIVPLET